ncbi:MAG: methionine--tRNA ligase [Methanobacteriota archaeon]|nr:MAG: methionine--tRNA ligase [Euryarchaeota archaeon]
MERVLVCCAWPYANGPIHVGHVTGSLLPADIFARFNRLVGKDVMMVSGSDMHGAPITVSAHKEGVSPEEIADRYHRINSKAIEDLGISFSLYTHTHTRDHEEVAKEIFLKLMENGHLSRKSTPQYYCTRCSRFLPDRYVEGSCPHCDNEHARGDQCDSCGMDLNAEELSDARCQLCGSTPELRETEHFFLRLSDFTDELTRYVERCDHWRTHVRSFTLNVLRDGLIDRPITRDISWGVPVPVEGFESKRMYVWFEAVMGYLSATKEWAAARSAPDDWERFWKDGSVKSYYFLGKDNIVFHTVIWPAMLLGVGGLNLPHNVVANQFMNFGGQKFSKSMGVSIDIPDILTKFSADVVRYYLTANMPEFKDSEFTWKDFAQRINSELVATFGNFVHRAMSFTFKNYGAIPHKGELDERDKAMLARVDEAGRDVLRSLGACEFREAMKSLMDLAQSGNQYFDAVAPWSLVRTDKERCGTVLHVSLEICKALAVLSYPFMPSSAERMWRGLCMEGSIEENGTNGMEMPLKEGSTMEKPAPLFAKVETGESEAFSKHSALDLKVGKVTDVQAHPNADKLYLMDVDVGKPMRIVSGLKDYYTADELREKVLIIVTNLEPAKLRGVMSEGMLLAAEEGGALALLTPEKPLPAGTQISSGLDVGGGRLSFNEFQKLEIRAGTLVQADPPKLDVGGRTVSCTVTSGEVGRRYAAYVRGSSALVMYGPDDTKVVFDRDIAAGARIR